MYIRFFSILKPTLLACVMLAKQPFTDLECIPMAHP
jgi:hypothetical protein